MDGVSYKLEIGGSAANPELLAAIETIEVEDHAELADIMRLRVAIRVRDDGADWTVLDRDPFQRLAEVSVSVTVGTRPAERLIRAHVVESRVAFSNDPGASRLEVVAMDPSVLLNLEEKVRPWPDMTDADIASTIFGEYSFASQVQATQPARQADERTVIQRGTDMQFLRQLAERNGFECYVELDATGTARWHFHPPALDTPSQGVLSVSSGEATNVNAFNARDDMLRPATAVADGLDAESGEDQSANSERPGLTGLGARSTAPADRPRRVLLSQTGLSQSDELQTYAQAVVDRSSWSITAEGELNTVAYGGVVRAKRPIQVRGAGRRFSGTYYVERVHHSFSADGYVQRFTLRRNASGVQPGERVVASRALAPQGATA